MNGFYGGAYAGGPYAGMFSAQPPAGAAVMGFPVAGVSGPPQHHHHLGSVDPALLGELWALDEADFAAVRIETPRGGAGLFGGAAAGYHPALAGFMAAPPAVEAPAAPPPWAPPPGGQRLRCLDPTHTAPCHRCTPAPPREAVGFYNLVGDPGRKNGEKKLKHQILRTAEWASPHARATLAASCERDGFPALARVLRGDATSAALRKADFLHLTRSWGYASDVWKPCPPRGDRASRAPRKPRKR